MIWLFIVNEKITLVYYKEENSPEWIMGMV